MNEASILNSENQSFHQTIKKIREYANLKDDWYINSQLDILEKQIAIEITKAELNQVTELKNFINKQN